MCVCSHNIIKFKNKKSKSNQDIFMCTIIIKFPFSLKISLYENKINYQEKLCSVCDDEMKINFTIHNQKSSHDCLGWFYGRVFKINSESLI